MCKEEYYLWVWNEEPAKDLDQLQLILSDSEKEERNLEKIRIAEDSLKEALEENKRLSELLEQHKTDLSKCKKDFKNFVRKTEFYEHKYKLTIGVFVFSYFVLAVYMDDEKEANDTDLQERAHRDEILDQQKEAESSDEDEFVLVETEVEEDNGFLCINSGLNSVLQVIDWSMILPRKFGKPLKFNGNYEFLMERIQWKGPKKLNCLGIKEIASGISEMRFEKILFGMDRFYWKISSADDENAIYEGTGRFELIASVGVTINSNEKQWGLQSFEIDSLDFDLVPSRMKFPFKIVLGTLRASTSIFKSYLSVYLLKHLQKKLKKKFIPKKAALIDKK
jgi:hypothetical protein